MTYLDELAAQIEQEISAEVLPQGDTGLLFRIYALLALAKGTGVTSCDVHDAWAVWMQQTNPHHRAIRPYDELGGAAQAADEPFVTAIRAVAERFIDHQALDT